MKAINKTKEAIIWLVLLLPFIYALIIWSEVPDQIPTHFDMNFEDMPELHWVYAYPLVLFVTICLCIVLYIVFKRSGWL